MASRGADFPADRHGWAELLPERRGTPPLQGSHRELLGTGGLYSQLWERQSGGFLGMDGNAAPPRGGDGEAPATLASKVRWHPADQ